MNIYHMWLWMRRKKTRLVIGILASTSAWAGHRGHLQEEEVDTKSNLNHVLHQQQRQQLRAAIHHYQAWHPAPTKDRHFILVTPGILQFWFHLICDTYQDFFKCHHLNHHDFNIILYHLMLPLWTHLIFYSNVWLLLTHFICGFKFFYTFYASSICGFLFSIIKMTQNLIFTNPKHLIYRFLIWKFLISNLKML